MTKFALIHIEEIKGKIDFYYLESDGKIQYKEFENGLIKDGGYERELITIQNRMQEMAEIKYPMPSSKCKKIGPDEYELKTKNLRCYLFTEKDTGRVIVTLSKKHPKSQNKDIRRFRKIKEHYLS